VAIASYSNVDLVVLDAKRLLEVAEKSNKIVRNADFTMGLNFANCESSADLYLE
jgi:hypothetical protein